MLANLEEGPEERQPLHFPARGEGHHGREPKRMRRQQRAKRPDKKVEIYYLRQKKRNALEES